MTGSIVQSKLSLVSLRHKYLNYTGLTLNWGDSGWGQMYHFVYLYPVMTASHTQTTFSHSHISVVRDAST